jgi:hypothetical protein
VSEAADPANFASLLLAPVDGSPRSVLLIEGLGDEVIPNQATEALALASGLPLLDPFVQNLFHHPLGLPVVGPYTITANAGGGLATAAVLQVASGHEAAGGTPMPGSVTLVPGFAHWGEYPVTGEALPALARAVPVGTLGVLDSVLNWFGDVAASGPPGTFAFEGTVGFNPVENIIVPAGSFAERVFDRTVGLGGSLAAPEATPDVTIDLDANTVETRVTIARTNLGTTVLAADGDLPPGPASSVGVLGFLPFFVTLQREVAGTFSANLTIDYSVNELGVGGVRAGSTQEEELVIARFTEGACTLGGAACSEDADCGANGPCAGATYVPLPTVIDTDLHTATATGLTDFSTFAVMHPSVLDEGFLPPLVQGGPGAISDCRAEWLIANPNNEPFRDRKGRVNGVQRCNDGDPTCDSDRTPDGICTFRIAVCFNHPDPALPLCNVVGDPILSYELSKPKPLTRNVLNAANAQRMLNALTTLGGFVSGIKQNIVFFTPSLTAKVCTELTPFQVKHKDVRFGGSNLRGMSRFQSGAQDVGGDKLRLRCYPPL